MPPAQAWSHGSPDRRDTSRPRRPPIQQEPRGLSRPSRAARCRQGPQPSPRPSQILQHYTRGGETHLSDRPTRGKSGRCSGNAASGASAPPAAAATRGMTVMEGDRKPAPETRGWDWLDPARRGRARGLALAIVPLPSLFSGNTDQAQALLMALARQWRRSGGGLLPAGFVPGGGRSIGDVAEAVDRGANAGAGSRGARARCRSAVAGAGPGRVADVARAGAWRGCRARRASPACRCPRRDGARVRVPWPVRVTCL